LVKQPAVAVARSAESATLPVRATRTRACGAQDAPVPSTPRIYTLHVGDELTIEIEQPDGARSLLVGRLDGVVPHSYWRERALKLRLIEARACALPPKMSK
jgi:hypothetical protein